MIRKWKCLECNDIVTSDSDQHHQQDTCQCGQTAVDLEEGYMRITGTPTFLDEHGFVLSKLVCYGCCHSAASGLYPGGPSGERSCMFCVRNPDWEECQKKIEERNGHRLEMWYDGTLAIKIPMDCYHSLDMLDQMSKWEESNKEKYKQLEEQHKVLQKEMSKKSSPSAGEIFEEVTIINNTLGIFTGLSAPFDGRVMCPKCSSLVQFRALTDGTIESNCSHINGMPWYYRR